MKEQDLIKKIKRGDQHALNELVQAYYPQVFAFLSRKLAMDDRAKDLTQEVFVRFIRYLPSYRHQGKLLAYLYRIASNVCKDYFKQVKYEEDIDDVEFKLADTFDLEEETITKLRKEELMMYINKLKDDQQTVILLRYFHQMTFQEIADIFDIPVSTVKTRHISALAKLRKFMIRGEL